MLYLYAAPFIMPLKQPTIHRLLQGLCIKIFFAAYSAQTASTGQCPV